MSTLCGCGRPTNGRVLCSRCEHTADVAIANVAAYHDDLETVRTRQTRYTVGPGVRSSEKPLGMDARFGPTGIGTRALAVTRITVVHWTKTLRAEHPELEPPRHDSVRSACAYLARNLSVIAARPWADEFLRGMLRAEKDLARIVDRPPDSWYAGICGALLGVHDESSCGCACHLMAEGLVDCDVPGGCGLEYTDVVCTRILYATPGEPFVRCGDCGSTYDVANRRDQLLREAEDRMATVEMITRIVTTLGDRDVRASKVAARIRQWAVRGRITSHGTRIIDGRLRPVYRIGDVLDLLARDDQEATK